MSFNINAVASSGVSSSSHRRASKTEIETRLKALGIPADVFAQGPDAVKKYAAEHNIDLSSLEPPKKDDNEGLQTKGFDNNKKQEFEAKLEALGIPKETVAKGKEAVETYARENNISLPKPPKQGSKIDYKA